MYIARHMTDSPVTVTPETLLPEVKQIMTERGFRHLPVVDENRKLVGMVSDRDLRSAYPSSILSEEKKKVILGEVSRTEVLSVMSDKVRSLTPLSTLDDALYFFARDKVGVLPVVDEQNQVVGVFSVQDLMKAYQKLYGIGERGSAIVALEEDGKPRPLTRIVRVLEDRAIHFSRLTRVQNDEGGKRVIYLRVHTFNINAVHKVLQEIGMKILIPDVKDL